MYEESLMKTSRKEYRRPVLEDLGTAKDLTRGGRNGYGGSVTPGDNNTSNGPTKWWGNGKGWGGRHMGRS